jgi:L-threonylcarbamoyladenylate synthase
VAAPSANRFGGVSPTSAAHVAGEFAPGLLILDGGDCPVGIESAIVDCCGERAVLLRPGVLTRAQIESALGEPLGLPDARSPRASGTLASHYAPRARVLLRPTVELQALLAAEQTSNDLAVYSRSVKPARPVAAWRRQPDDALAAAHELFAALRELDAPGVARIVVETPPDDPAWEGVRDRLQRAAADAGGAETKQ